MRQFRNTNKSEFSSGPMLASQKDRSSPILETGSSPRARNSPKEIKKYLNNENLGGKRMDFSDNDIISPPTPPFKIFSQNPVEKNLLNSKYRIPGFLNNQDEKNETLKSLIDNYFSK